jgi:hypothetical protein
MLEVDQAKLSFGCHEDVASLKVAVNYPIPVQRSHNIEKLMNQPT